MVTLDRDLHANEPWIRTRHNGSGQNVRLRIYLEDLEKLQLTTATGGKEILEEER